MAIIKALNEEYTGLSAGIEFNKGIGETSDPYLISWFKSKGYEVVEPDAKVKPEIIEPEVVEPEMGSPFDESVYNPDPEPEVVDPEPVDPDQKPKRKRKN